MAARSSSRSDASTTRLPPSPGRGSAATSGGSPASATWSKTSRKVATSARAKASSPWSMRLATYTPSGVSTRRTSRMASRVVRCQGTLTPPKASPTTRSRLSSGSRRRPRRPSSTRTSQEWSGLEPQPLAIDLDHTAVDLGDEVVGPGAYGGQVARQREPAAAEVVGPQRLALGVGRVGDRRDHPDVGEDQEGRVLEVDVGVPQRVEHQCPAVLVGGVVDDHDAVVGRLGVAATWCHRHRQAAGDDAEQRPWRRRSAAQPPARGWRSRRRARRRARPGCRSPAPARPARSR